MRCEDRCSFMLIDRDEVDVDTSEPKLKVHCNFHDELLKVMSGNVILRCKQCERYELYNRLKREVDCLNNTYCEFVKKMDMKFDEVFTLIDKMELDL